MVVVPTVLLAVNTPVLLFTVPDVVGVLLQVPLAVASVSDLVAKVQTAATPLMATG
jgi:hypothetical protein